MQDIREIKIAFLHTYSRNDSTPIGVLTITDELERKGYKVSKCDYKSAHNYTHVLVSMTATDDIYHIYKGMKKANWDERKFKVFIGGFGCQNPIALSAFADYSFFGRADGIIEQILFEPGTITQHIMELSKPTKITLRQIEQTYPNAVNYGKNKSKWKERFIGCPFRCKFCHYSHNRKYVGDGGYVNDQLSSSPEVMLKDIVKLEEKKGRLTCALDGYSERLRYKYGKRISWEMVEDAMDHLASFKGNTYLKLYNITNFPTETEADREEFKEFFKSYVEESYKADGLLTVEVFNTAFRPSLNTPMERCAARLFPEARQEITSIAKGNGFNIKYTHFTKGAWEHLKDLISIRYTNKKVIEDIAMGRITKLEEFISKYDVTPYVKEYKENEELLFKYIK